MHWQIAFNLLFASQVLAAGIALPARSSMILSNTTSSDADANTPTPPVALPPSIPDATPTSDVDSDMLLPVASSTTVADASPVSDSDSVESLPVVSPPFIDDATTASDADNDKSTSASDSPSCTGLTTYDGRPPLTIYETITESFDVTVTASDASITETETLITPPPACVASPTRDFDTTTAQDSDTTTTQDPDDTTTTASADDSGDSPSPLRASFRPFGIPFANAPLATLGAEVPAYTVTVTKKTPVAVVVAASSTAPTFGILSASPPNTGTDVPSATYFFTTKRVNVNVPVKSTAKPTVANVAVANFVVTSANGAVVAAANTPPPPPPADISPTAALGNVVAIAPAASPLTTSIGSVGVTVFQSSIAIGTKILAIPAQSQTQQTVKVGKDTYTVKNSEVIGPSTTLALSQLKHAEILTTPAPKPTVVTADGLTLTVGASSAVIAGKTYKIGSGIAPTSTVVHGKTISIGPNGVGLPDTTVAVPTITGHAFAVESAEGVTFSIDASEAVISGTTYRIGAGASAFTTVIGGHTISIGSGGLGFAKTTARPTTVAAGHGSKNGSKSGKGGATATGASASQTGDVQNAASAFWRPKLTYFESAAWMFAILASSLVVHLI